MKRLPLLFGLLALLAAVWGWFQWRNHTTQVWLESASREQLQTHLQSHAEDPRALLRFGVLLRDSGEREEARKQLRRAVERDAGNEQAWVEYSRALDNPQEALSFLETFLKDHPDSATVQAEFVQRVLQTGDLARALTLA